MIKNKLCSHLTVIESVKIGEKRECSECVKSGGSWVHLRTCQTCGETLCCDDSPMKHMTEHFHKTEHPVMASAEPGERWLWCFADRKFSVY